ncbi:MAG: hypothetical protein B9S26_15330 [Opitutia bacterium Tous-C4FEB]|nr:MAG: hypothetical protein B9S26_15330 [Opitutae bacterium Tous-C4FEB]
MLPIMEFTPGSSKVPSSAITAKVSKISTSVNALRPAGRLNPASEIMVAPADSIFLTRAKAPAKERSAAAVSAVGEFLQQFAPRVTASGPTARPRMGPGQHALGLKPAR